MNFNEKTQKIKNLKKEVSHLEKQLKQDLFRFIMGELNKMGYVDGPTPLTQGRGCFNKENKVSVWVGHIYSRNVDITLTIMTEDGSQYDRTFGNDTIKRLKWDYVDTSFEDFIKNEFDEKVQSLENLVINN